MSTKIKLWMVALLATGSILTAWAGELEPTAPPESTMKTLQQVEPRTPIHAADLPRTIDKPGSYYLAENIVTGGGGITIIVSDVTIDLMGFALTGGTGNGITALNGIKNVTVKNGTVRSWPDTGVELFGASNSLVLEVRVEDNGNYGIALDHGAIINCVALKNHGTGSGIAAIYAGAGSVIAESTARANDGDGILTGNDVTVTRSVARANLGHGIVAGWGAVVSECSAGQNQGDGIRSNHGLLRNCTTRGNQVNGIYADSSSVRGCVSRSNGLNGIYALGSSVAENTSSDHPNGAGIRAVSGSSVQRNRVTSNEIGIDLISIGNTMFQNSAWDNLTNYQWVIGNDVGPMGSAATATSPWANIEF